MAKIHFFQNLRENSCPKNIKYKLMKCIIIIEPILRLRTIVFTAMRSNLDRRTKMRIRLVLPLLFAVSLSLLAQENDIKVRRGIPYSQALFPGKDKMQKLCFDFYEPAQSSDTLRPLVITAFGGGFVLGNRDYDDMVEWCERFVKVGYAAASIDYRLMPGRKFSSKELVRTGYMAAQDVSAAVRFFKAHGQEYGIDTGRIFLLGQSAGAVAILHAVFMDENERPAYTYEEPALPPLHSLGTEEAKNECFSVAGVVSLWGCIFDPEMLDADETTPICLIHGGKDKILPADSGYAFSIPGLPYAYGSEVMAEQLKKSGTSSFEFHFLENESHAFYFKYLCIYQIDELKFDRCFEIARSFMLPGAP